MKFLWQVKVMVGLYVLAADIKSQLISVLLIDELLK
ncbi:hypothetical protein QFZ42_004886 [Variovorax paradoxus]|jgi:hypothetical protein|nr:hypothetical protein [Variovorax paradoxus]